MAQNNNGGNSSLRAHAENGPSFEQSFLRLQEVVQRLSEGNLTLQEALASFEEGMALADRCSRLLEEAELRVKQVSDRAMRAGLPGAAGLKQPTQAEASDEDAEPELLTFEVETYEGIFFDAKPQKRAQPKPPGQSSTQPNQPEELDPLFDEDD